MLGSVMPRLTRLTGVRLAGAAAALGMGLTACSAPAASPARRPAATAAADSPQQPPAPPSPPPIAVPQMLAADPITLKEMIERSRTIVHGTVRSIERTTLDVKDGDTTVTIPVRHVEIAITHALKGEGVQDGGVLRVTQSADESSPLAVGEEILWYLPGPSRLGLVQPIGLYSGDFRITGPALAKRATNLHGNDGLWTNSAWQGTASFDQTRVMAAARQMDLPEASVNEILRVGTAPRPPGAVPLNMLLSITSSALAPQP